MKALNLLTLLCVLSCAQARADNFTCLVDHEEEGSAKANSVLRDGVVNALRKLGIAMKEGSFRSEAKFTYYYETNDRDDSSIVHASLEFSGSLTTASGTDLLIFLKNADNEESPNYAFFRPVLTHKGFDKEGNPIAPHCTLNASRPFVSNLAVSVAVRNARSGKIIASIPLPKAVSVY